jgi:hypothetical protein
MSSLSKEAREVLEAGVRGEAPTMADRQRARARLGVALATSIAAAPIEAPAAPPRPWLMKGVVGTATVLVVAAGTIAVWTSPPDVPPGPPPAPPVSAVMAPPVAATPGEPVELPPRVAAPATPAPRRAAPAIAPPVAVPARRPVASADGVAAVPSDALAPLGADESETLEGETRALQQVHGALKDGDASRALRLLAEHETRFPRGQLRPERQAARVLALCATDLAAGRAALAEFLEAYPGSPLLPRVKRACSP